MRWKWRSEVEQEDYQVDDGSSSLPGVAAGMAGSYTGSGLL